MLLSYDMTSNMFKNCFRTEIALLKLKNVIVLDITLQLLKTNEIKQVAGLVIRIQYSNKPNEKSIICYEGL